MAKTDETSALGGLEALSKMIGSGKNDPETSFLSDTLNSTSRSKKGNVAHALAGLMSGQRNSGMRDQASAAMLQDQMKKMQRNYDAAMILQKHEQDGLGEDMTFKAMMQRYAMTGDDFYKNIATQFKPASKNVDPITMKKNYVISKWGSSSLDDAQRQAEMQKDPVIQHFDQQIYKYLGVSPDAVGTPTPSQIEANAPDQAITSADNTQGKGGLAGIWDAMFGAKQKVSAKSMPESQAAGPASAITPQNYVATAIKNLGGKPKEQVVTILKNQMKAKRISQDQAAQIYDELYGENSNG